MKNLNPNDKQWWVVEGVDDTGCYMDNLFLANSVTHHAGEFYLADGVLVGVSSYYNGPPKTCNKRETKYIKEKLEYLERQNKKLKKRAALPDSA